MTFKIGLFATSCLVCGKKTCGEKSCDKKSYGEMYCGEFACGFFNGPTVCILRNFLCQESLNGSPDLPYYAHCRSVSCLLISTTYEVKYQNKLNLISYLTAK